jgi:hypothetical protein
MVKPALQIDTAIVAYSNLSSDSTHHCNSKQIEFKRSDLALVASN